MRLGQMDAEEKDWTMTYRKTWFSYVLWAAYAGLCVTLLSFTGYHIYAKYMAASLAKLGALLIFPALVSVYLAIRLSCQAIRKRHSVSAHGAVLFETLTVSVSFVFGLLLRIHNVLYAISDAQPGAFYERALVRAGEEIKPMAHGLSHLYVLCLSTVFSFLGNGQTSAMLFQALLELVAMALAYGIVKKTAGRLCACVVLVSLAFSDVFLEKIAVIDPECLYLVLYLAGLLSMVGFIKLYLSGRSVRGSVLGAVFTGILVGALLYLELWSATLLFFLAGLFIGKKEKADTLLQRFLCFFVTLLSCAGGFLGAVGIDAAVSQVSFQRALTVWAYPYSSMGWNGLGFDRLRGGSVFWAVLVVLASFLVFEFIRSGREQDHTLWLFVGVLFTPFLMADLNVAGYGSVLLFLWSVLAGLGLKNCVLGGQAEVMQAKLEEINALAGAEVAGQVRAAAQQFQEKPRYIENPLPVPQKHIKRDMDYDHEVPEADMHFDVETAAGDDYEMK